MDLKQRLERLEELVVLQGEVIKHQQGALNSLSKCVETILGALEALNGVSNELTVKVFKDDLENMDKCGDHCGCGKHDG